MAPEVNIFWFRRDLRLTDNTALRQALQGERPVQCLFIFDSEILGELEDPADARVTFIHQALHFLQKELVPLGATLDVRHGRPMEVFEKLLEHYRVSALYTNRDYEPYARERDAKVERLLRDRGIDFYSFKDQVIFDRDEVVKENGDPYHVFTPYSRKWLGLFESTRLTNEEPPRNFYQRESLEIPSLRSIGFREAKLAFPPAEIDEGLIRDYDRTRDFPSLEGTSRLGIHLRFGTLSIRELADRASRLNKKFLSELIWREFYQAILWHHPRVVKESFRREFDRVPWRNNENEFAAWCAGRTGYPLVDAGMRQLNETGYMHNRLRMVTASFLSKHLLVDWRWGEAYFAARLLDYELASNNGGWQWAAGTGCDAAPYFRIFNPALQAKKFDPYETYTHRWVPEIKVGEPIPPIVDHAFARTRCLQVYGQALRPS